MSGSKGCSGLQRDVLPQECWHPEKTSHIVSQGVHVHDEHNTSDSARVFSSRQDKIAREYLASTTTWTQKGFTNYLVAAGFGEDALPSKERRARWLRNHQPQRMPKQSVLGPPRAELMQRTQPQWPTQETCDRSQLFLVVNPPYVLNELCVCLAFSCKGMADNVPLCRPHHRHMHRHQAILHGTRVGGDDG